VAKFIAWTVLVAVLLLGAASSAKAQKADGAYPRMAPLEQYLMADRDAEIVLAKSAAPKAISDDGEVMALDRQGYRTVVRGSNGFVCLVQRSWTAGIDAAEFWNPKIRAPICFNAAAVRSYLPIEIAKTDAALAGAQTVDAMRVALDKEKLPTPEAGAMCYMMSKEGYLNDQDKRWHPHLMFFVPLTDAKAWGANLLGSPILAGQDPHDRVTIFLVPVAKWSDGSADSHDQK